MGILDFVKQPKVRDALTGVLGVGALGFNPALGLLAGPAITASRERRQLENDLIRERLETSRSDRAARRELQGLLAPISQEELAANPNAAAERQAQLMGVLGRVAPAQVASSILQPSRAEPADLRMMDALGIDRTPQGFAEFQKMKSEDIDGLLKRLQADKLIRELEEGRRETEEAGDQQANAIQDALDGIDRLAAANDALEGTFLESGGSFLEAKRDFAPMIRDIARATGQEDVADRINKSVESFDKLRKETSLFAQNTVERLNEQGVTVTRALQGLIEDSSASEQVSPGTNRSIMRSLTEKLLREADRLNIPLPERERYEDILRRMEGQTFRFATQAEAERAIDAGALREGDLIEVAD
mgnify:CR=1 FL=1